MLFILYEVVLFIPVAIGLYTRVSNGVWYSRVVTATPDNHDINELYLYILFLRFFYTWTCQNVIL